jgi:hypothetical protein
VLLNTLSWRLESHDDSRRQLEAVYTTPLCEYRDHVSVHVEAAGSGAEVTVCSRSLVSELAAGIIFLFFHFFFFFAFTILLDYIPKYINLPWILLWLLQVRF